MSTQQALRPSDLIAFPRPATRPSRVGSGLTPHLFALPLADVTAFAAATLAAHGVAGRLTAPAWWQDGLRNAAQDGLAWHGWTVAPILLGLLAFLAGKGHYTKRLPFWMAIHDIALACACALALDCLVANTILDMRLRLDPALRWILFMPALLAGRAGVRLALGRAGLWSLNTVVIGEPEAARAVEAALNSEPALGYRLGEQVPASMLRSMRTPRDWARFARQHKAQLLVLAGRYHDRAVEASALAALSRSGVPFASTMPIETLPVVRRQPHYFISHDVCFFMHANNLAVPVYRLAKRGFDVAVAAVLLLLLLPLFAAIILAIRLEAGPARFRQNPALFRHKRVGANGKFFHCLKFRSMRVDSAEILDRLLRADPAAAAEWRETQKLRHDPRISRIGGFLRKTSLDELPQLLNVLRGDMSLVGPRPIVTAEVDRYEDHISFYYDARPGLTGLWQVSGRSDTTYAQRVRLDVWYVRNWSLWHDIVIMLKTVPALLLKKGAV